VFGTSCALSVCLSNPQQRANHRTTQRRIHNPFVVHPTEPFSQSSFSHQYTYLNISPHPQLIYSFLANPNHQHYATIAPPSNKPQQIIRTNISNDTTMALGQFFDPLGETEPQETIYTLTVHKPPRPPSKYLPAIFTRTPVTHPNTAAPTPSSQTTTVPEPPTTTTLPRKISKTCPRRL
jgi:hypothetical protein